MGLNRQSIEDLYRIFGLSPGCQDEDFRQAYRREILANHPDKNPGDIAGATKRTQDINAAYGFLKKYRENPSSFPVDGHPDIREGFDFTVTIDFGFSVDIRDISGRKDAFRRAYDAFQQNPRDVLLALQLIHASFMAERYREFRELLEHSPLIDSSTLLLQVMEKGQASQTLLRWADYLYDNGKAGQAIQIVEDAFTDGARDESILERLRDYHYRFAQGYHLGKKQKPAPSERISHLSRILDLGFELDYIHKLLAEAFYENGDSAKALAHLKKAKQINPDFSGAVKISRALGLLPPQERRKQTGQQYQYAFTKPEQIPHPSQIRTWASEGKWEQIMPLADMASYSPRIIPSSRSTIRQVAASLGDCPDERALKLLQALRKSIYWDVRKAVESSLARWGKGSMPQVAQKSETDEAPDIVSRLWGMLVFEEYHPSNDQHYLTALTKLGYRVLNSLTPDDILASLREMTRWLELIGEREMTTWIRELIRREAPGTRYVDPLHRDNYINKVKASKELTTKLAPLFKQVKLKAPNKLSQVLGSQPELGTSQLKKKARNLNS